MAKGVEDTSFYVWVPLASVNEVGGDPRRPTTSPQAFHDHNLERTARYRQAMLASTTHDTKRTEDVRARLNVLSEVPSAWRAAVQKFARLNKRWRREVDGEAAPSLKDEYLFYQSAIGIWPLNPPSHDERASLIQRLQDYMEKAIHEAKQRTSWLNPSRAYDEAVREFVAQTLRDSPHNRFVAELQAFLSQIAAAGQFNALSQLIIKFLSPGVPDIYQGQELWDYSLVDPDNRRPVDYDQRRWLLGEIKNQGDNAAPANYSLHDQRLKLLVTQRLLAVRRQFAHLWAEGAYLPLEISGPLSDHLVAFGWRGLESQRLELIAIVPRFVQRLIDERRQAGDESVHCQGLPAEAWTGTVVALPDSGLACKSVFTGRPLTFAEALDGGDAFADFPVAVFASPSE
jgi:(1->4)-alpha-D-glucan 1-alpha-D-glucosylmutase